MHRWCKFAVALALFGFSFETLGAITGNFTLTSNTVFTSSSGVYSVGATNKTFNLQGYTATFTGAGDFQVYSKITGSGKVNINLSNPNATIEYNTGNSYTGDTTVTSGRLLLDTTPGADNGVPGNLIIGGGPNQAVVTRHASENNALIGDNSTIRINQNGVLEFNRSSSWGGESLERWGTLIMNGGSIINVSDSPWPTVGSAANMTLLASSVIDLGNWMSFLVDDVSSSSWNPNAILTIKNWSILEPVFMGGIDQQKLSQIRFETSQGTYFAQEFGCGFVIPSVLVPEVSSAFLLPLLGFAAVWTTRSKRAKSKA